VSNMSLTTGTIHSLQGSFGTGKSHILAFLVRLLLKEGKRVVYKPDAGFMATVTEEHTKHALELAYTDDRLLFKQIHRLPSIADLLQFLKERTGWSERWYVICDQIDALDYYPDTDNTMREALQFRRLSEDHYFI